MSQLSEEEERQFQEDYKIIAKRLGLHPDPDHPLQFYDYRAAWKDGAMKPGEDLHFPSKYKLPGHPNRFVSGIDTITGKKETREDREKNRKAREAVIRELLPK